MDEKPMVVGNVIPLSGPPPLSPPPPGRYTPGPPPPPPRSGYGCVGAWAMLATLGLGFSMLLNMALVGAKGAEGASGSLALNEKVVEGEGDAKVVLIQVEGVIQDKGAGGGLFGGGGEGLVKRVRDQLEKAGKDEAVKAVVLAVDSPGGTVTASDQIHHALMDFRTASKKPLVVHQGALAASGGYYISAAADEIFCEPTTITGSIGVILGGMNFHKLLKDHGVEDTTVTSGPNKDLLSQTGPVRETHRVIIQETVDDMYGRFCEVVAEGIARRTARKVDEVMPEVKKLADGRIYTARQALGLKLVDSIGYFEDAFKAAKKRANVTTAKLIRYKKEPTLGDILSGNVETKLGLGGVQVKVDAALVDELSAPRFLMLWRGE